MSFRAARSVALALVLGGPLLAQEPAGPEGKAAPAPEARQPEFKTPKGGEAWKQARELFDLESYRDSLAEMEKALAQAKGPADRAVVQEWVTACKGGMALDGYKKMVEKGSLRQACFMVSDMVANYRKTPIGPRFVELADDLRTKVLEVLESFDHPSTRYSEKFGKSFIKDPAIVFRGAHCLQWTSVKEGKGAQLKIANVPSRWTSYHSLVFWLRCERPVDLLLMTMSPASAARSDEPDVMSYSLTPSARPGWSRVQVEMAQFKKNGAATLANVESFVIQIEARTTFKLYIDEIALVRKDPSEASPGAAADPKEDKKKSSKKGGKTGTGKIKQSERKQS